MKQILHHQPAATVLPEHSWDLRAACLTVDRELFFPRDETTAPGLLQIAEAKRVCAMCPARPECLDFALDTGSEGVFGGMSTDERRREAGRRRRAHRREAVAA